MKTTRLITTEQFVALTAEAHSAGYNRTLQRSGFGGFILKNIRKGAKHEVTVLKVFTSKVYKDEIAECRISVKLDDGKLAQGMFDLSYDLLKLTPKMKS